MKKIVLVMTLVLSGCGGVLVDQEVLSHVNQQCKDNGGIYKVYIGEGLHYSLRYYTAYCKDGSDITHTVESLRGEK